MHAFPNLTTRHLLAIVGVAMMGSESLAETTLYWLENSPADADGYRPQKIMRADLNGAGQSAVLVESLVSAGTGFDRPVFREILKSGDPNKLIVVGNIAKLGPKGSGIGGIGGPQDAPCIPELVEDRRHAYGIGHFVEQLKTLQNGTKCPVWRGYQGYFYDGDERNAVWELDLSSREKRVLWEAPVEDDITFEGRGFAYSPSLNGLFVGNPTGNPRVGNLGFIDLNQSMPIEWHSLITNTLDPFGRAGGISAIHLDERNRVCYLTRRRVFGEVVSVAIGRCGYDFTNPSTYRKNLGEYFGLDSRNGLSFGWNTEAQRFQSTRLSNPMVRFDRVHHPDHEWTTFGERTGTVIDAIALEETGKILWIEETEDGKATVKTMLTNGTGIATHFSVNSDSHSFTATETPEPASLLPTPSFKWLAPLYSDARRSPLTWPWAISPDGKNLAGAGSGRPPDVPLRDRDEQRRGFLAFRAEPESGPFALVGLPNYELSYGTGVSDTGRFIAGRASFPVGPDYPEETAFLWDRESEILTKSEDPSFLDLAWDVSANGDWVCGRSAGVAALWQRVPGRSITIGDLPGGAERSELVSLSASGNHGAGNGNSDSGKEALFWQRDHPLVPLGDLDGGAFYSKSVGISSNGKWVVGTSEVEENAGGRPQNAPFIWNRTGGMRRLGWINTGNRHTNAFQGNLAEARGVSNNGIVVGGSNGRAFIWHQAAGMHSLTAVLKDYYGISMEGVTLLGANAISSDGLWVTGFGVLEGKPENGSHGFVAAIPNFAARINFLSGKLDHLADDDDDGAPNIVELALGSDPFIASSQPQLEIESRGGAIAIQVPIATNLDGVTIVPERLDENTNSWTSEGLSWATTEPGMRTVVASFDNAIRGYLFRVRVVTDGDL